MIRIFLFLVLFSNLAFAESRQVNDFEWEGVERIIAVGDLHGDYDNYLATLRLAGLIDKKGKWIGGKTHLVQTGDIPDRGPDTLKIIEHISKLQKQAKRKGGRVHILIGNHEAMNVSGDLRYVHEGEFAAFKTRNSAALRDRVFDITMKQLEQNDPQSFANLPDNYREEWNLQHPLGWVEHRQAWDPGWNPDGKYSNWVLERKVAIRVNDNLFLHGGISAYYCQNSLDWITDQVVKTLRNYDPESPGIVEDEFGPLWYRGLSGDAPRASMETVDAILDHHGASRIIVGHTPTSGVIWPRYDAKVVIIDTGISSAYGGHVAYLEILPDGLYSGYPKGKLPLPSSDADSIGYLENVISMAPDNPYLKERLGRLQNPVVTGETEPGADSPAQPESEAAKPAPTCGISQ